MYSTSAKGFMDLAHSFNYDLVYYGDGDLFFVHRSCPRHFPFKHANDLEKLCMLYRDSFRASQKDERIQNPELKPFYCRTLSIQQKKRLSAMKKKRTNVSWQNATGIIGYSEAELDSKFHIDALGDDPTSTKDKLMDPTFIF